MDESYIPISVSIRVGTNFNNLQEIEAVVRTFLLQFETRRDTPLRQIKVFSLVVTKSVTMEELPAFTSIEMRHHMFVR